MQHELPSPYIVYLCGSLFARESKFGHKHLMTNKRLNPIELRKNMKLALLVDLYFSGYVEFEVVKSKGLLVKREDLVIKVIKNIDRISNFFIEEELLSLLRENGAVQLKFYINRTTGFEDKFWMDAVAKRIVKELTEKGYLLNEKDKLTLNAEKIVALEEAAKTIKRKIEEFQTKNPELAKIIYKLL